MRVTIEHHIRAVKSFVVLKSNQILSEYLGSGNEPAREKHVASKVFARENSRGKGRVLTHRSLHLGSLHPEGHVWASIEGERVL